MMSSNAPVGGGFNPTNMLRAGMGAAGLGGLGAGLMGLFGGSQKNPYDAAAGMYGQIPDILKQYLGPYANLGFGAANQMQGQANQLLQGVPGMNSQLQNLFGGMTGVQGNLQNQFQNLMSNPSGVVNQIGAGYQQSPGYQFQVQQAMNAARNSAAAGGMSGSPQAQQQAMTMATNLANQDYYNYLNKAMGAYGTGLEGAQGLLGMGAQGLQGLYGINLGTGTELLGALGKMGFGAASGLGGDLASALMSQGNLAYAGQAAQNQAQQQNYGSLFGGLGSLLGMGMMFM